MTAGTVFMLFTLGRPELREGTSRLGAVLPLQPKRLALLAYLAGHGTRGAPSRDQLLAHFWPDATGEEARAALRQALHQLRRRLGEASIVSTPDGRVELVAERVACDASQLEQAARAGDHASVLALYQGDFLDGLPLRDVSPELEEWLDHSRRRFRAMAAESAASLALAAEATGQVSAADRFAARWREIAPDDEAALRARLRLLAQQGREAEALALAEHGAAGFASRLGVPLAADTLALVERIRANRVEAAAQFVSSASAAVSAPVAASPAAPSAAPPSPTAEVAANAAAASAPVARRLRLGLAAAGLVAVAGYGLLRPPPTVTAATGAVGAAPSAPDRVIVLDFRDRGDGLGAALSAALRVDLAQSVGLRVIAGSQVRDALQRAGAANEPVLTDSAVRSLAVREGLKGFVTGEVYPVQGTWLLTARLVSAHDGSTLLSHRETAADSTALIPAMERLSRALARDAARLLATQPPMEPLARVTTTSLAALRAYGDGVRLIEAGERDRAIAQLQTAVALDTAFATAWRILGVTWSALNEPARSREALQRAFTHRQRLVFRERHLVEGSYHRNVTGDYPAAIAAYRALLAVYPADQSALNNLALIYTSMSRHAAAESLLRQVTAADSSLVNAHLTLAEQVAMQGHHAEAWRIMRIAQRKFPEHPVVHMTPIYLAASEQDWGLADSLSTARLARGLEGLSYVDALQTQAHIEMLRGRLARAQAHLRESMRAALVADTKYRYLVGAISLAWIESRYRDDRAAARAVLDRALSRVPLSALAASDQPRADLVRVLLASGDEAWAVRLAGGPDAPQVSDEERPVTRALLALAAGHAREAAVQLDSAAAHEAWCAMCLLPQLATARAEAGDVAGAVRAAEEYLQSPFIHRFEPDAVELPALLTQLAGWHEQRGGRREAAAVLTRLLRLWEGADPELAGRVADARRRVAMLEGR